MDEKYPVIIDGTACGVLCVSREGLMTVFEAECPEQDRLIRLSVFGADGTEGKLGVMMPENGVLHLRKSFSRTALELFPGEIVAAGETGAQLPESAGIIDRSSGTKKEDAGDKSQSSESGDKSQSPEAGDDAEKSSDAEDDCPQESQAPAEDCVGDSQSAEDDPGEEESEGCQDCAEEIRPEPGEDCESEAPEDLAERDMLWFPVPEGTLVSINSPSLLAMPWREGIAFGEERVIEGRRYAVIAPGEIAIPAEA